MSNTQRSRAIAVEDWLAWRDAINGLPSSGQFLVRTIRQTDPDAGSYDCDWSNFSRTLRAFLHCALTDWGWRCDPLPEPPNWFRLVPPRPYVWPRSSV